MNNHVREFYKQFSNDEPNGHFHKVIALQEAADVDLETVSSFAPALSKGWYELAHLKNKDRIDFLFDFWLSKLPFHPKAQKNLEKFFSSISEIGVYLVQKGFDDPFKINMVYSLKNETSFYRGEPSASEEKIAALQQAFPSVILPEDYKAFLRIHDGFSKTTDCTGVIPSTEMLETYKRFQEMVEGADPITMKKGVLVDPKKLIPFYESFGMPFFQCFWADWYPQNEMGNVYFSAQLKTISNVTRPDSSTETMAFPTYMDWLFFYLEQIT